MRHRGADCFNVLPDLAFEPVERFGGFDGTFLSAQRCKVHSNLRHVRVALCEGLQLGLAVARRLGQRGADSGDNPLLEGETLRLRRCLDRRVLGGREVDLPAHLGAAIGVLGDHHPHRLGRAGRGEL